VEVLTVEVALGPVIEPIVEPVAEPVAELKALKVLLVTVHYWNSLKS
jgi:hypothetical protein